MRGKPSVGIIERDPVNKVITIAKPMGVIACITPSTNPTATPTSNAMCAFKCGNAMIIAAHPKAKNCTKMAIDLIRGELARIGAPIDLIQMLPEPSIQATNELLPLCDAVIATGGPGMVKSAYSCGRPSFGVGAGNVQCIIGEDFEEYDLAAKQIITCHSYENGITCAGEQTVILTEEKVSKFLAAMQRNGAYLLDDVDIDHVRDVIFDEAARLNRAVVGKDVPELAELFDIQEKIPDTARVIVMKNNARGMQDMLCKEIGASIVRYTVCTDSADAISIAKANLLREGQGHTAIVYSDNSEYIEQVGLNLPVSRVLVKQPGSAAGGCNNTNGLCPTMSLGCGTCGNNSISENLNYMRLMNKTRIAYIIEDAVLPSDEELWAE